MRTMTKSASCSGHLHFHVVIVSVVDEPHGSFRLLAAVDDDPRHCAPAAAVAEIDMKEAVELSVTTFCTFLRELSLL